MKNIRAKFVCQSVQKYPTSEHIKLIAVTDGSEENKAFWQATPSGQMDMSITNPDALGSFEQGKSYYLDFTLAED